MLLIGLIWSHEHMKTEKGGKKVSKRDAASKGLDVAGFEDGERVPWAKEYGSL